MKKCPKCQAECLEESKFCGICGHNFKDSTEELEFNSEESTHMEKDNEQLNNNDGNITEVPEEVTSQTNDVTDDMVNEEVYEVTEEVTQEEPDYSVGSDDNNGDNKGKNKVVAGIAITAIVAILALATVLIFGKNLFQKQTPEDRIVDAYMQYYKAKTLDVSSTFSFSEFSMNDALGNDAETAALVSSIVKDLNGDINVKIDKEKRIIEGVMDIKMEDTNIMSINFYVDEELIGLNIPFIHDKTFYVTWDSAFSRLKDETGVDINWKDYLELLDPDTYPSLKKIDEKVYTDLYKEYLKGELGTATKEAVKIGDKNVSCTKYPMDIDYAEAMDFLLKIMDQVLADENVKAFVYEVIDTVSDKVIANEDYTYMNITEEEFKEGIDTIKAEYENALKEMNGKTLLEIIAEAEGMDAADMKSTLLVGMDMDAITIQTDIYLDKNNTLRKIDIVEEINNAEVGMSMGIKGETVINSMNKKLDFKGVDKSTGINPLDMNDEELQQLMMEIQGNVMKEVMTNPFFSQFLGGSMF